MFITLGLLTGNTIEPIANIKMKRCCFLSFTKICEVKLGNHVRLIKGNAGLTACQNANPSLARYLI